LIFQAPRALCLFRLVRDLSAVFGLPQIGGFVGIVAISLIVPGAAEVTQLLHPKQSPLKLEIDLAIKWRIIKHFRISSCSLLGFSFNFQKADVVVLKFG